MCVEPHRLVQFFCIGTPKTGTTLLARVLDQHPEIACVSESYAFHPRSRASLFNPASEKWRSHGFSESDVRRWARVWRAQPKLMLRRLVRKLTGRTILAVSCFQHTMGEALADFARRCDARAVGDKWPWYIDYLEHVLSAFPSARFIYNVRDPRGVWNSAQRFKARERGSELLTEMLSRDLIVTPYLDGASFLTVRYEDLVCQPEETCQRLYNFLGCSYSEKYVTYDPEKDPYPERWDWVPQAGQPIDPWHAVKWREQMTQTEIETVTTQAAWFIRKYRYEQ